MRNVIGLRIRNVKFPWVKGTIESVVGDEECPERPDYPRTVMVKWDDQYFPTCVDLKHLEEQL